MAEISFGIVSNNNIVGSGLGFYGSTFGSSVQIGSYQDKTFVTNAAGTLQGPAAENIKFQNFGSGIVESLGSGILLANMNQGDATLVINFDHTSDVNVQNCQLKIYDRVSTTFPASGVLTKCAEIVNMRGVDYATWNSSNGASNSPAIGSGDLFWWGAPWHTSYITNKYYTNSVGTRFNNYTNAEVGNGDSRLGAVAGDKETVGGSGLVMPLLDNPGSGGRFLDGTYMPSMRPKFLQYYSPTVRPGSVPNLGAATTTNTYGSSGIDKRHSWRVALSASPISVGSKSQYGLEFSCEYL